MGAVLLRAISINRDSTVPKSESSTREYRAEAAPNGPVSGRRGLCATVSRALRVQYSSPTVVNALRRCKFLGGSATQRCASRVATAEWPLAQATQRCASRVVRTGQEKQAIWSGGDRALTLGGRSGQSTFRLRARAAIPGGANTVRPGIPDRYICYDGLLGDARHDGQGCDAQEGRA